MSQMWNDFRPGAPIRPAANDRSEGYWVGGHRYRFGRFVGWRKAQPTPPPPWAGGIVVNRALEAEAEAYQRAEEARRREEAAAQAELAAALAKSPAQTPSPAAPSALVLPRRPLTPDEISLIRHCARCRVCRHPQREAIDQALIDWTSPREVTQTFRLGSERAVYRHAHAFGLFKERRDNRQTALDYIIEQARHVSASATSIVAAIRLSAQLDRSHPTDRTPPWPR